MEKREYEYCGTVKYFDQIVESKWYGTTWATSAAKAKNNLSYRYKKERGFTAQCKITLPDKIYEI